MTGGFAGGELGLQKFLEKGEIEVPKEKDSRQSGDLSPLSNQSPILIATLIASTLNKCRFNYYLNLRKGIGTAGGIILTDTFNLTESFLSFEIKQLPMFSNPKLTLEVIL